MVQFAVAVDGYDTECVLTDKAIQFSKKKVEGIINNYTLLCLFVSPVHQLLTVE